MATILNQMIDQLKSTGKRLLEHPSSITELLNLLEELDRILSKFGQSPSQPVQEALLVPMRALISDDLIRHSDDDVKVIVASCLNEIMRISAPVAPYDDRKMKEFFELIVFSFEKLSSKSNRSYSKAVSILESVARLRSCVMMLDLDCDPLLVKMFELFQKNFSSDHPPSVLRAMETIMSIVIMESDTLSLDLVKVLLASIRKDNEHAAPISWKLGAKLIEQCMDKLKPYISTAVSSMGCCLEDFAPILSSNCKNQPDSVNDCVADPVKHPVNARDTGDKTQVVTLVQGLSPSSQNAAEKSDSKALGDQGTESGNARSKKGKKSNSFEGHDNRSVKGKSSLGSPDLMKKRSPFASKGEEKAKPASEGDTSKEETRELTERDQEQPRQATSIGDSSDKKRKLSKSMGSESVDMASSKSTSRPSKKDKSQINDASKSRKKQTSVDDDFIETPHGRKRYKEDLVGSRIKVWWPLDHKYYEGKITSYDAIARKHRVDYDDGDEEILNLDKECWEFIGDEIVDYSELFAFMQTCKRSFAERHREGSIEVKKEASQSHSHKGNKRSMPDSRSKFRKGNHQVTNQMDTPRKSETTSETKRTKLSDEHKS